MGCTERYCRAWKGGATLFQNYHQIYCVRGVFYLLLESLCAVLNAN